MKIYFRRKTRNRFINDMLDGFTRQLKKLKCITRPVKFIDVNDNYKILPWSFYSVVRVMYDAPNNYRSLIFRSPISWQNRAKQMDRTMLDWSMRADLVFAPPDFEVMHWIKTHPGTFIKDGWPLEDQFYPARFDWKKGDFRVYNEFMNKSNVQRHLRNLKKSTPRERRHYRL